MLGIGQHAPFGVIPFAPVGGATLGGEVGLSGASEKSLNLESYSVTGKLFFIMEIWRYWRMITLAIDNIRKCDKIPNEFIANSLSGVEAINPEIHAIK